jgi:hypothetical protein
MTRHENAERFIKQGNCDGIDCEECFARKAREKQAIGSCYKLWGGMLPPGEGTHLKAVAWFEERLAKWRKKHEKA